jgi:hypothetical protein
MGGMFTVVKVRDEVKPGDYRDPGWFKHRKARWPGNGRRAAPAERQPGPAADENTLKARKPTGHERPLKRK